MPTQKTFLRVLVVDDHATLRERIVRMIANVPGVDVVSQTTGVADTLAAIQNLKPDVILLDLRLADGSGLDVLRVTQDQSKRPILIVLTDNPGLEFARVCATFGAYAFLDKAYEFDTAVSLIRELASTKVI